LDFKELEKFLNKIKMQHIYQPVMIKTLIQSNDKTTQKIAKLFLAKDQSQIDFECLEVIS
jgi:hypothetical protein